MQLSYSFIIPVYNRPNEIDELLQSMSNLNGAIPFEVVLIEDGSSIDCKAILNKYKYLNISYFFKENSGPGASRNYGMKHAKGNYYIILDSDCLLPKHYLIEVDKSLKKEFAHCFGGPDAAHKSFTSLQKAINFAMTSFMTTGGIRGKASSLNTFQPRSFNMGLSKEAFIKTNGFGNIHPGEDPDLSIRLWNLGYKTRLFENAFVYHKRRISWKKFYQQVHKFGLVRPILSKRHPSTSSLIYWFPTLFVIGLMFAVIEISSLKSFWLLTLYAVYFLTAFVMAFFNSRSLAVSLKSILAILVQFFGYGYGFLKATIAITMFNKKPETCFKHLFFNAK